MKSFDQKYPFELLKKHADNYDKWTDRPHLKKEFTFQNAIELSNDYLHHLSNTDNNVAYPIILSSDENRNNARLTGLVFEKIVFEILKLEYLDLTRTNENYSDRFNYDFRGWDIINFQQNWKCQIKFKKINNNYPLIFNTKEDSDGMQKINITVLKDNSHSLVFCLSDKTIITTTHHKIIDLFKKYVI